MKSLVRLFFLCGPSLLAAQAPVEYAVSFPNAVHNEAEISVTWRDIGTDPLQMRMSRSSPGRYAIHEFAKNVYALRAADGSGRPLSFSRPNPYQWDVAGHDGTVTVTYTLYANRAGGTYSGIDRSHAHLNMPATFMWARGFEERPVRVAFAPADSSWRVATQLPATDDPYVFTAPDLTYFLDSPTELSDFDERSWEVDSGGRTQTIRLVVHHEGSDADVDQYLAKAKAVVDAQIAVFGELPEFDYGSYTFIADYLPWVSGDGMEHRNSTILTSTQALYEADFGQLGTLSHEFIHAWNAERIRPRSLEPFDFERANMSFDLWFVEGFTSYYGPLTIHRAGESSVGDYLETIAGEINAVTHSPGRRFASPRGMSIQAPFVDAASAIDPTNFSNTFISYYTYGAALGLALDLSLRERYPGLNLDAFMREVWDRHGRTEIPYRADDLQAALAAVTGDEEFAAEFFSRYIEDSELADYAALLENAGLLLRPANPGVASAGRVSLDFEGRAAIIQNNTVIGSPLYVAGLERGDEIVSVGRFRINSQNQWNRALRRFEPGDSVTVRFIQRGQEISAELRLIEDPELEVVRFEDAGREVSAGQLEFRADWLGSSGS